MSNTSNIDEIPSENSLILYIVFYITILIFAGLESGLTIGLMSLDLLKLKVLSVSGSKNEQKYAKHLLPLLKRTNFLLSSLLLANAIFVETLPVLLDRIAPSSVAIIVSVVTVLIVGEFIPQVLFKRYNIAMCYYSLPFIYVTLILTSPIAWPLGKLLDSFLSKKTNILFSRQELMAMVKLHGPTALQQFDVDYQSESEQQPIIPQTSIFGCSSKKLTKVNSIDSDQSVPDPQISDKLSADEVQIMTGAMLLCSTTVMNTICPVNDVFMLSTDDNFNSTFVEKVMECKYSRIPVCEKGNPCKITHIILVKMFLVDSVRETLLVNGQTNSSEISNYMRLGDFLSTTKPPWAFEVTYVPSSMKLSHLLCLLCEGKHGHMVAVAEDLYFEAPDTPLCNFTSAEACRGYSLGYNKFSNLRFNNMLIAIGTITLEDVLEHLFQVQIDDEMDWMQRSQ